jgi:hypothetical protein
MGSLLLLPPDDNTHATAPPSHSYLLWRKAVPPPLWQSPKADAGGSDVEEQRGVGAQRRRLGVPPDFP